MPYTRCKTHTIHYSVSGSGPPLLFLHGTGATPRSYQSIIEALAQRYTVYAPDLLSHGKSSLLDGSIDLKDYADLIHEFHQCVIQKKCLVIGHSLGGAVALSLAAHYDDATKLILVNPLVPPITYSFAEQLFRFTTLKVIGDVVEKKEVNALHIMGREFFRNLGRNTTRLHLVLESLHLALYEKDIPYKNIKEPVSILWSNKDRVFPASYRARVEKILPNAQWVEVHGGHSWALFRPQEFMKVLERCL